MPEESQMKQAMQAYIDHFNAADPDAVAALYTEDATVEDPVGSEPKRGREAILEFYRMAVQTGAKLSLAAPIRASHADAAAMAFDVNLQMPEGRSLIRVIDVMRFDDAGRFRSMEAYWGPSDVTPAAE
ncbi:nuclear transport factor 2 family protein [Algiphilus aromaticivorans]|uniref:nuclear transport factor 2 family protein n=1 Tax=Algiphilus aromaticivorans TaxID=382454 RepID=UPI0005C2242D|nr:nuclear transport factor 2 family protein [Algiphilus aromaticivorans]